MARPVLRPQVGCQSAVNRAAPQGFECKRRAEDALEASLWRVSNSTRRFGMHVSTKRLSLPQLPSSGLRSVWRTGISVQALQHNVSPAVPGRLTLRPGQLSLELGVCPGRRCLPGPGPIETHLRRRDADTFKRAGRPVLYDLACSNHASPPGLLLVAFLCIRAVVGRCGKSRHEGQVDYSRGSLRNRARCALEHCWNTRN